MQTPEYDLERFGDGWAIRDQDGTLIASFPLHDTSRAVGELDRLNAPSLVTRRAARDRDAAG